MRMCTKGFFSNVCLYLLFVQSISLQANKTGKSYTVPLNTFYVKEICSSVNAFTDITLWLAFYNRVRTVLFSVRSVFAMIGLICFQGFFLLSFLKDNEVSPEKTPVIFCRYPFVLPLICKTAVFNILARVMKVYFMIKLIFHKYIAASEILNFLLRL